MNVCMLKGKLIVYITAVNGAVLLMNCRDNRSVEAAVVTTKAEIGQE